jgi:hypothetical protein
MQTRYIAIGLGLIAATLFLLAVGADSNQKRTGLVALATLGLGLTNMFLRIGENEGTAR